MFTFHALPNFRHFLLGFRVQRFKGSGLLFPLILYSIFDILRFKGSEFRDSELMVLSISTLGILDHFRSF